jgi:hypothetical protein
MYTVGPGCHGHVDAIVDENARAGMPGCVEAARHQTHERTAIEVAFPYLHEIDAGPRRGRDRSDQGILGLPGGLPGACPQA